MDEIDALKVFYESWVEDGVGADGLPLFKEQVMIRLSKWPQTQVEYVATDEHFNDPQFRDALDVFKKQRRGRDLSIQGYPLAMWPVISPAALQLLSARDIVTVEQLAAIKKTDDVIPEVRELSLRAKKLIELQGKTGKFEAIISELTAERDALAEQLKEAHVTISAQNSMIGMLQSAQAPRQVA
jgi:hypothetical protein